MALLLFLCFSEQVLPRVLWLTNAEKFQNCQLVLESGQAYSFDSAGRLELQVSASSQVFEIHNQAGDLLFLGFWRDYSVGQEIQLTLRSHLVEQLLVSARRARGTDWDAPNQVALIDFEHEAGKARQQTSDYLKEQASVALQKTNLGGGSPIIRGLSGNRVLLMYEGFRMNNTSYRLGLNQYLNGAPSGAVSHLEVVHGPAGVLYGSDSLGGTLHLRAIDPEKLAASAPNYQGSLSSPDGTSRHRLQAGAGLGGFAVGGHFSWDHYGDLSVGGDLGEQAFTGFNSSDASLLASQELSGGARLRYIGLYSEAPRVPRTDRLQSGSDLEWLYQPQIFSLQGLRYERPLAAKLAQSLQMGLAWVNQEEGIQRISARKPMEQSYDKVDLDSYQFNAQFNGENSFFSWVYGLEAVRERLAAYAETRHLDTGLITAANARFPTGSGFESLGLFTQFERRFGHGGNLSLGMRQSWTKLYGTLTEPIGSVVQQQSQLTPALQISVDQERFFIALGVNGGFRAPSMEDSLVLGPQTQGFDAPNPNLKPEQLWSYEGTARLRGKVWQLELNAYRSKIQEMIERVPGAWLGSETYEGEAVFINANNGEGQIDGMALAFRMRPTEAHEASMDLAWTEGQNIRLDEPMTRIPPLRGNLKYSFEARRWQAGTVFSWAVRQDRLSANDLRDSRIPQGGTPGYGVVHARVSYKFSKLDLHFAFENLFDAQYKVHGSGIYESGRRATLSLTSRFR